MASWREIEETRDVLNGYKISASCGDQITRKQICQFFLEFDKIYRKMMDLEKKEFMRTFIKAIELYLESDDPTVVIQNWMRNWEVIEFLGLWERLHNPDLPPRIRAVSKARRYGEKLWI